MTPRQRMLTAMRGGIPDRVPVAPDISNMIPARMTGKPFWEIYLHDEPSLGDAYLDAVRELEMDGWYLYGHVRGGNAEFSLDADLTGIVYDTCFVPADLVSKTVRPDGDDKRLESLRIKTPDGPLSCETLYFRDAPPWDISNFIKEIERDWPRLCSLMGTDWHWAEHCTDRDKVGELAVYGIQVHTFVDFWDGVRDGQSDTMLFDFYDTPELMDEIFEFYRAFTLNRVRGLVAAGVDEVLVQGSNSSMSLINPAIYERWVLPLNRDVSRLVRELGCIAHLHTCGKSRWVVEQNLQQSSFHVIEPLEKAPSGDVDIGEVRRRYGQTVSLKGNILTSGPLLSGSPDDVEAEVVETLCAAGTGGAFILSTGDQVGGNTPLENLRALISAGRKYGRYASDGSLPDLQGHC